MSVKLFLSATFSDSICVPVHFDNNILLSVNVDNFFISFCNKA